MAGDQVLMEHSLESPNAYLISLMLRMPGS